MRSKLAQLRDLENRKADDAPDEIVVGKLDPNEPPIIQKLRKKLRLQGKSYNTEKSYVNWIRRFMKVRNLKTEQDFSGLDNEDIESFLTDLVVDECVSPSTQDQAFYSLLFLFQSVLKKDLGKIDAMRSSKPKLVPTVMSRDEVSRVLNALTGVHKTIGQLLYGCGLRLGECLRLRIMDIDFDQMQIRVHNSKGKKSRLVPLPASTCPELKELINQRFQLHQTDLADWNSIGLVALRCFPKIFQCQTGIQVAIFVCFTSVLKKPCYKRTSPTSHPSGYVSGGSKTCGQDCQGQQTCHIACIPPFICDAPLIKWH